MKKRFGIALAIVCVIVLAASAQAWQENVSRVFYIGTVIGEENTPCYYYASPEAGEPLGYYYPGTQLAVWAAGPEWCHFDMGRDYYMPSACVSVTEAIGTVDPIGFAFVTFPPDDPAAQSTDSVLFIPLLCDCNPDQTAGDPLSVGVPLQLLAYCGDMVQVRLYATDGFVQRKHVNILTYDDLFSDTPVTFLAGYYPADSILPAGLYHAATDGEAAAEIRVVSGDQSLTYTVDNLADTVYSLYLPAGVAVTVSAHGSLTRVTGKAEQNPIACSGGRLVSGIDADLQWISGWEYTVCADDTEDAYFVRSTLWNDQTLTSGEVYTLAPGETRRVKVNAGEIIELHHCRLESDRIAGWASRQSALSRQRGRAAALRTACAD